MIANELTQKIIQRICSVCGNKIEVILYPSGFYRGGHFFFTVPLGKKEIEYWECKECFSK